MKLLNKEQIQQLNTIQAREQLQLLEQTYPLYTDIAHIDLKIWMIADDIANQLLWLEDHIHKLSIKEDTVSCL